MVTTKKWEVFEDAEVVLERRLRNNPNYPFHVLYTDENGRTVYVHSRRPPYFYFSVAGCAVSILWLIVWLSAGGDRELLLYVVVMFVVSCYFAVEYHSLHSVVFEPFSSRYSIYTNHTLTTSYHAHNIYLRLNQRTTGFRETKFYLAINGLGFEYPILVSNLTVNRSKLRLLAYEIARQLNLNYFDINDVSKLHIIRHERPHQGTSIHRMSTPYLRTATQQSSA